jgi:hypothetical protein
MKLRKLVLVKYDYDSFPDDWKQKNPNPYKDLTFCYLGDIHNMPGHSIVITITDTVYSGRPRVFHTENLKELTEDET